MSGHIRRWPWLLGLILALVVGLGITIGVRHRQEVWARSQILTWSAWADYYATADQAAEQWELVLKRIHGPYGRLPLEDRRVFVDTLATKFYAERNYGKALKMMVRAREMVGHPEEELIWYVAALAGEADWLADRAKKTAASEENSHGRLLHALLAWCKGDHDTVLTLAGNRGPPAKTGPGADLRGELWLQYLKAKILAQRGDYQQSLKILTDLIAPNLPQMSADKDFGVEYLLMTAEVSEKAGDIPTALASVRMAGTYLDSVVERSYGKLRQEARETCERLQNKLRTQEKL
jgi:tetratricopeptide (TPR) repeat protein